tara:strand:+ start:49 stop:174 length:126 start_codon:yes stop_codon:yes gene_type:complete
MSINIADLELLNYAISHTIIWIEMEFYKKNIYFSGFFREKK